MVFWGWIAVLAVTFGIFGGTLGCSNEVFAAGMSQTIDASPDGSLQDAFAKAVDYYDGGPDGNGAACEANDCRPGCGSCDQDAGLKCGNGGIYQCGGMNCTAASNTGVNSGIQCLSSDYPVLFGCNGPLAQDAMPSCASVGTSSNYRWYCCK